MCSRSALRHRDGPILHPTGLQNPSIEPRARERHRRQTRSTTQQVRPKPPRARCKLDGVLPSSGLLVQPDTWSCPMDDRSDSVDDSEQASAASTVPLLITLLSLVRRQRCDIPRHRRQRTWDLTSNQQLPQLAVIEIVFGRHHRHTGNIGDTHLGVQGHLFFGKVFFKIRAQPLTAHDASLCHKY